MNSDARVVLVNTVGFHELQKLSTFVHLYELSRFISRVNTPLAVVNGSVAFSRAILMV